MARRKTLAERNAAAYAPAQPVIADPTPQPIEEATPETAPIVEPTPITKATGKNRATEQAPRPSAPAPATEPGSDAAPAAKGGGSIKSVMRPDGVETWKVSIHVPKDVWEDSRRAYVATLDDTVDPPLSHSDWIEEALWAHLERDPELRQGLENAVPEPELAPVPRPVYITEAAQDAINEQSAIDRKHGMWRSRSAWIVAAMRVEVAIVRDKHDGVLPEAPDRLPRQTIKASRRRAAR